MVLFWFFFPFETDVWSTFGPRLHVSFVYFTHTRPMDGALQDKFSSVLPKMKDSLPKGMRFASSFQNVISKFITCAPFQSTGVRPREQNHRQRPCLPFRKWLPKPQRVNLERTSPYPWLCGFLSEEYTPVISRVISSWTLIFLLSRKKKKPTNKQQQKEKQCFPPKPSI